MANSRVVMTSSVTRWALASHSQGLLMRLAGLVALLALCSPRRTQDEMLLRECII